MHGRIIHKKWDINCVDKGVQKISSLPKKDYIWGNIVHGFPLIVSKE